MLTHLHEMYSDITQSELNHNEKTDVDFTINNMLQGCVRKLDGSKMCDTVVTLICCDSADNMFLNSALDVLSSITRGS